MENQAEFGQGPIVIITDHLTINDGLGSIELTEISPTRWILLKSFSYTTNAGKEIIVPEGFVTDGASSPLRILIKTFGGRYNSASITHDYLYWRLNSGNPSQAAPTRADADAILMEIMAKCNVNYWVRWGIYLAVRTFGGPDLKWLGVKNDS